MKKLLMATVMILSLALPLSLFIPPIQAFNGTAAPKHVIITGNLYVPGEEGAALNPFTVNIEGRQWILDVQTVRTVQGEQLGLEILNDLLFPSALRFVGPHNLLGLLDQPENAGRPVTIEGYVHVPYNYFEVTGVGSGSSNCLARNFHNEIQESCAAG